MQVLFVRTLSIVLTLVSYQNNKASAASLGFPMMVTNTGDPNANLNIPDILNGGLVIQVIDPSQVVLESGFELSNGAANKAQPMMFTPMISPEFNEYNPDSNSKFESTPPIYTDDNMMMMMESQWKGIHAIPLPITKTETTSRQKRQHFKTEKEREEMIKANAILRSFLDRLVGIGTGLRVISSAAYRWLSPW